jgi:hypothetical protein
MDEQKRIKVTINPIGKPTVEAVGFNGVGCAAATDAIEKALAAGSGSIDRNFKPEYTNDDSAGTEQHVQQW